MQTSGVFLKKKLIIYFNIKNYVANERLLTCEVM